MTDTRYSRRLLPAPTDNEIRNANYAARAMGVERNGHYRLQWAGGEVIPSTEWRARREPFDEKRFTSIKGVWEAAIALGVIPREMLARSLPWNLCLHERVQPIFEGLNLLDDDGNSLNDLGLGVYFTVMADCGRYLASDEHHDDFLRRLFARKHRMTTKEAAQHKREMNGLIEKADAAIEAIRADDGKTLAEKAAEHSLPEWMVKDVLSKPEQEIAA